MDLKAKLINVRQKLLRRSSGTSQATTTTTGRSIASSAGSHRSRTEAAPAANVNANVPKSISLTRLPRISSSREPDDDDDDDAEATIFEERLSQSAVLPPRSAGVLFASDNRTEGSITSREQQSDSNSSAAVTPISPLEHRAAHPAVTLQAPSPIPVPVSAEELDRKHVPRAPEPASLNSDRPSELRPPSSRTYARPTSPAFVRPQSLVDAANAPAIKALLEPEAPPAAAAPPPRPPTPDCLVAAAPASTARMPHRKIWVKRPNASATVVQIREDDFVDDVRDMIIRKYANSLGRSFDAPDVVLRIHPREGNAKGGDRILGPEEEMCRILDAYYPGGQTVHEALLIEVPQRRTPKPSPRLPMYYTDDPRPLQDNAEYFPIMPAQPSPAITHNSLDTRVPPPHAPSISVLQTGQLPPLASPGLRMKHHASRPKNARQHTSSPTMITSHLPGPGAVTRISHRQRQDSTASETKHSAASGSIPTPPPPTSAAIQQTSTPPVPRVASPRLEKERKKQKKQKAGDGPGLPASLLDGSVPPINVLIVEDNIINLRVLGAFMQRLKVRWQRAMNGREAVTKWRGGGFHLVIMDIQMPIMNGLEATKEIRRLERVNTIGVFSSGSNQEPNNRLNEDGAGNEKELSEDDKLGDKSLFKSPVIIVALTASSLQSDRHEALAAGCNDFLTKVSSQVISTYHS
jgi:osomolarity two-component system response regulator SSK1